MRGLRKVAVRLTLLCAVLLMGALQPALAQQGSEREGDPREEYGRSIVGLSMSLQSWDEDRPWIKRSPANRSANGVMIDDRHLLTTADTLEFATYVQLEVFGRSRPVEPRIVRIDPAINLALLAIDDEETRGMLEPVTLAAETPTSGELRSVRWNGRQIEAASSRIVSFKVESSWSGRAEHAFLQLRTDLSGGGWSEPVFGPEGLVGITASQSKQISRVIPIEIVREFLARAEAERYEAFPALGAMWQINGDAAVSRYLGQSGEPRGVLIRQIPWGGSACGTLEPRDILLEVDGHAIDAEGYFLHERFGRLRLSHLFTAGRRIGETIPLKVLRAGKEQSLEITLRPYPAALDLIPGDRHTPPPFLIVGGLVMRELDVPYLRTWGNEWTKEAPPHLMARYYYEQEAQTPDRRRIVLITSVFPSGYNRGYHDLRDEIVETVNGRPIGGLRDVLAALETPGGENGEFHVIGLSPEASFSQVVLDAAGLEQASAEILQGYRLPGDRRLPEPAFPGGGECPGQY